MRYELSCFFFAVHHKHKKTYFRITVSLKLDVTGLTYPYPTKKKILRNSQKQLSLIAMQFFQIFPEIFLIVRAIFHLLINKNKKKIKKTTFFLLLFKNRLRKKYRW